MNNIVCFGEAIIDFLGQPGPDQTMLFKRNAGGAPANVAVAVACLGGNAVFVGMFSQDSFGDFLLDSLNNAGVDIRYVARTNQANTALAFVTLNQNGERSFSFYRPPAADLLFRNEHFNDAIFGDMYALHVCSNSMTEPEIAETTFAGMLRAREAGALVSFDMNLRLQLWSSETNVLPRLWRALQYADLVKLSEEEMNYLITYSGNRKAVLDQLWEGNARLLIVTNGADPIQWYTSQGAGKVNPIPVEALDTTAAGDAFVGGLLTYLAERNVGRANLTDFANSDKLDEALRFASACGAIAVTRLGSFSAMPNRNDVQQLIGTAA